MSRTSRPIELCWVAPKRVARIRRRPAWRHILDEAAHAPPDEPGEPALSKQDVPPDALRDVLLILARADATDGEGVAAALSEGVHEDGKFAPPLVLVAGELRFPFGEIETLKATVTTATPFTPGDEPLKAAVDARRSSSPSPASPPRRPWSRRSPAASVTRSGG